MKVKAIETEHRVGGVRYKVIVKVRWWFNWIYMPIMCAGAFISGLCGKPVEMDTEKMRKVVKRATYTVTKRIDGDMRA